MAVSRKMSKRSRRMGKSRASKTTMKKAASKRSARRVSRKAGKRSSKRRVSRKGARRSSKRRMTRRTAKKMGSRKMSAYQKFVKSHRGAIKAESRKSGKKFLQVAAVMYKASGAKGAAKPMKKSRKMSQKLSGPANMRLHTLFSRLPGRYAAKKSRRMSKRKASKKSRRMSKRRVSRKGARRSMKSRMSRKTAKKVGSRKAGGLALFIKQHKAEVMEYAKQHGMVGKPGYVIKAGAAVYKMRK